MKSNISIEITIITLFYWSLKNSKKKITHYPVTANAQPPNPTFH